MKSNTVKVAFLILILLISGSEVLNSSGIKSSKKKPQNIILFIGDGMGVGHLYAGMTKSNHLFSLEMFPFSGFSKTYSADNYITDSAAAGTAIACGVKTNNGMIGVTPDSIPVQSILEIAHKNGLATGIISTSAITHATPASFVSHNSGRGNYEEIAKDFLNGSIDLFIGGGEDHFRKRADSADLTITLKDQGYDVVYSLQDLQKSGSKKIAGLLAKGHMPTVSKGREGVLKEITRKAIETLSKNEKGFFLMVEGSMIDWGAHAQNIDYVMSEMIDLDEAVGVAREFAQKKGNTLVIVTADHETGGLSLVGGDISEHKVIAKFSGIDHTAEMVPVFSYGKGAENFSGIHENTFFFGEFIKLLNLTR